MVPKAILKASGRKPKKLLGDGEYGSPKKTDALRSVPRGKSATWQAPKNPNPWGPRPKGAKLSRGGIKWGY